MAPAHGSHAFVTFCFCFRNTCLAIKHLHSYDSTREKVMRNVIEGEIEGKRGGAKPYIDLIRQFKRKLNLLFLCYFKRVVRGFKGCFLVLGDMLFVLEKHIES